MTRIKKSFTLDSEPVLHWPKSPAKVIRVKGVRLTYSGNGMAYALHPEKGNSVELVGWDPKQEFVALRNVFAEPQLKPAGLVTLASLNERADPQTVCEWVSLNGLLGFRPTSNPVKQGGHYIPIYVGNPPVHHYEPVDCIRAAAQRARNVLALWSALRGTYAMGEARRSSRPIQSIVTFDTGDSYERRQVHSQRPIPENLWDWLKFAATLKKEEGLISGQVRTELRYRILVNGEYRSHRPIPKSPRGWRGLAYTLLAEYIQEHIHGEVQVALGIQAQNLDENRSSELPLDWNLKPTWHIQSALAAYYVELLMVMRRFRSCKVCGKDISHQRTTSRFCGDLSTCRSVHWHRQNAGKRKATNMESP